MTRRKRAALGWTLVIVLGLVSILGVALVRASATWLDFGFARLSHGRVALAEAEGTLWQGSGRLVLVDVSAQGDTSLSGRSADNQRNSLQGVAVPGRVSWKLQAWPLLLGRIDLLLKLDGMNGDVRVQGSGRQVAVSPGALSLPAVDLSRLGSPWSTLRPSGALSLRWDALTIRADGFDGRAEIELREASAAISPVNPVGSYRVDLTGQGIDTGVSLTTLQGPLRMVGTGRFNARTGLRMTAEATADEQERLRLQSLLGLIGASRGRQDHH